MNQSRRKAPLLLAAMLLAITVTTFATTANAADKYKFSYFCNGRICVDTLGNMNGKPITEPPTKGWEDFKPSWSKTGNWLVFFRRVKNDADVVKWKTVLCIIKTDGTNLQKLTDDKNTNFNPTWTRDGNNYPIWNRRNLKTGSFYVMRSKIGAKPGEEVALTDPAFRTWAHSSLMDGRILVESSPGGKNFGYYLMTPKANGKSKFERIDDGGILKYGLMCRISISPDEKKICFGLIKGHKFAEPGHAMVIADFDAKELKITNPKAIANKEHKPVWFAYPRWTPDGKAVIYHDYSNGPGCLMLYTLKTEKAVKVSGNDKFDYRYPHAENTPK